MSPKKELTIKLEPLTDEDIPLIEKWLHQEYILRWYHEPEEWIREIKERKGEFSFLHHFMVYAGDTPLGFCQYYDCFDAQEDWYRVDSMGHTYSIDYLIGDEKCLGQGYGKRIIALLTERIGSHAGAKRIVVKPEGENRPSCKSLEACGFLYDAEAQYYYKYFANSCNPRSISLSESDA